MHKGILELHVQLMRMHTRTHWHKRGKSHGHLPSDSFMVGNFCLHMCMFSGQSQNFRTMSSSYFMAGKLFFFFFFKWLLFTRNWVHIISVQKAPTVFWFAKTWNLHTFILMVKMIVICYLFPRKYVSFSKKDNLQTKKPSSNPVFQHSQSFRTS